MRGARFSRGRDCEALDAIVSALLESTADADRQSWITREGRICRRELAEIEARAAGRDHTAMHTIGAQANLVHARPSSVGTFWYLTALRLEGSQRFRIIRLEKRNARVDH